RAAAGAGRPADTEREPAACSARAVNVRRGDPRPGVTIRGAPTIASAATSGPRVGRVAGVAAAASNRGTGEASVEMGVAARAEIGFSTRLAADFHTHTKTA